MAIVTHGTTLDGFKAIMGNKGKQGLPAPWTVSDNDNQMYFYDAVAVSEEWGDEYSPEPAQRQSSEQAVLQLCSGGYGGTVVVLTCDIPDDLLEQDYSCDNMENARCIPCDSFDPSWIVEIHTREVDQWVIPLHLACILDNSMFNTSQIPETLLTLAQAVGYNDCIYEFELDQQDVKSFIEDNA